jgi:hypothetical protein
MQRRDRPVVRQWPCDRANATLIDAGQMSPAREVVPMSTFGSFHG